jgi:sulfide:quinone oxidoreductase
MRRVLILGGGFGGVSAAHNLRQELSEDDEIILIDQREYFSVGFRKTWALLGISPMSDGQRPLKSLERQGISVMHETITKIDPVTMAVEVDHGHIEADAMIVALGSQLVPGLIPGFEEHALNVYNGTMIPDVSQRLDAFEGGSVVVGIFGVPYACPPAPYEIAILLQEHYAAMGLDFTIEAFTPLPMSLPILGDAGCEVIEGYLANKGIRLHPNRKALRVTADEIQFTTGRMAYDLLLGIPPHRCPEVVVEAGLAEEGGWVEVNPRSLETSFDDVYAIGDLTTIPLANGKRLPKAGVFAEAQGEVVAKSIAAGFNNSESAARFEGLGACFLEIGNGEALMVEGDFLAEPAPRVSLTEASAAYADEKLSFESERLLKWFGK